MFNFRGRILTMSARELTIKDNLTRLSPYPGKFSRKNKQGVTMSREEWWQEQTIQWVLQMKIKPAYSHTRMGNKARLLLPLLRDNKRKSKERSWPGKLDWAKCRKMIMIAEQKLKDEEDIERADDGERNSGELEDEDKTDYNELEEERVTLNVTENELVEKTKPDEEKVLSRTEKEFELAKLLELSDQELFMNADLNKKVYQFKSNPKLKNRKEQFGNIFVGEKSDKELFESKQSFSTNITETEAFNKRAEQFSERYFAENSLGSIVGCLPDIKNSKIFIEKIGLLSNHQISEAVVMKSLRETINALSINPSKEGKQQQRLLAAGVTSLEYGVPNLGLSRRDEDIAIQMKKSLMRKETNTLQSPNKTQRQVFPAKVTALAVKHWEQITIIEPAKLRKATSDGKEAIPTRYQTMTNQESYDSFKDMCRGEVKQAMQAHANERKRFYENRPDSHDKDYSLWYATEKLPQLFPSLSWWLSQRPAEVKPMNDHSTGLCMVI